jgi:hypothetical protein
LSSSNAVCEQNWKGRVSGFEALIKVFDDALDETAPEFSKYVGSLKKVPLDTNVMALEKGLAAIQSLLNNAAPTTSVKIAGDVIAGCLTKAILQTRPKIKELNADIILMYIELERQENVQEELLKGAANKSPKVASGCLMLLKEGIRQFGVKVFKIGQIIKLLPVWLEHKDKTIREEARQLSIEIYRWIKDAMKPQIANLKPVILSELDEEFNKIKDERAAPLRYLRSEQVRVQMTADNDETAEDGGDSGPNDGSAGQNDAIDPYDLFEPVEILPKLAGDFYEKCEAKKWQERKEALESLLQILTPNPKLAPGDYSELVKILKKIIGKDSNVMVVGVAAKCLAELATRLRKHFGPYSHSCVTVAIDKFKEKKQTVVLPLREAIDAVMLSISFENIIEDILQACENKNPQIKSEVVQFISRYISNSPLDFLTNKKNLKLLANALIKTLNDNDGGVREVSAESLGIVMKAVGEKTMMSLLADVDAIKITKIKEYYDKAVVKHSLPVARPASSAPAPAARPDKKPEAELKRSTSTTTRPKTTGALPRKNGIGTSSNKNLSEQGDTARPVTASKSVKSSTTSVLKVPSKSRLIKPSSGTSQTVKSDDSSASLPLMSKTNMKKQRASEEKLKWNFTTPREEYFAELKEVMQQANWNAQLIANCFHSDFKFHLRAIESIVTFLSSGEEQELAAIANSDLILKWSALRFFDTNPSVILKLLELLLRLFNSFRDREQLLVEGEAQGFIPYLILKTGDPKDVLRQKVHEIMVRLKDVYSPIKLFVFIMNGLSSKNSRQRATCIEELGYLIKAYGMGICQPSPVQACREISKQIGDKDSGVRNAALNCIVEVYQFEDDRVFKLIGNLNDKDMEMLEKRLKRVVRQKSNIPLKPLEPGILVKNLPPPPITPDPVSVEEKSEPEEDPIDERRNSSSPSSQVNAPTTLVRPRPIQFKPKTPATVTKTNGVERKIVSTRTRTPSPESVLVVNNRLPILSNNPISPEELHQRLESVGNGTRSIGRNQLRRPQYSSETADDLLAMPDVKLPARMRISNSSSPRRSFGGSAIEKIDHVIVSQISQLSQTDIAEALTAAQNLENMLQEPDRANLHFVNKVDQLIMLCSIQFKLILSKHFNDSKLSKDVILSLFRSVSGLLVAIFRNELLCKKASLEALKELISVIVNLLVDTRFGGLGEGNKLNRLANTVLSNADITNMLSALIRILHECISGNVGSSNLNKFTDLINKCIWKIIHLFKYNASLIELPQILYDMHLFLADYPTSYWENSANNSPIRTIRTILYLLVELKRGRIFNYLHLVPDCENTEIHRILRKVYELKRQQGDDEEEILDEKDEQKLKMILLQLKQEISAKLMIELVEFCGCRPKFHLEDYLFEHESQQFADQLVQQLTLFKNTKPAISTSSSGSSTHMNGNGTSKSPSNTEQPNRFGFSRASPRVKLGRLANNHDPQSIRSDQFSDWYTSACGTLNMKPLDLYQQTAQSSAGHSMEENLHIARNTVDQTTARKEQFLLKYRKN